MLLLQSSVRSCQVLITKMKVFLFCAFWFSLTVLLAPAEASEEIECDVEKLPWLRPRRQELVTCRVNSSVHVYSSNYEIKLPSGSSNIEAFSVSVNRHFQRLPHVQPEFFKNLSIFSIWNCSLNSVPGNYFKEMKNLETLFLKSSEIETVDDDAFSGLISLSLLDLSFNKIEYLGSTVFNELRNLELLSLADNKLSFLSPQIFENLLEIKKIYLSFNLLTEIDAKLFENNKKLELLSFNQNDIKYVSESIFDELKNLKLMALEGNNCISGIFMEKQMKQLKFEVIQHCQPSEEVSLQLVEKRDLITFYENRVNSMKIKHRIDEESLIVMADKCEWKNILCKMDMKLQVQLNEALVKEVAEKKSLCESENRQ